MSHELGWIDRATITILAEDLAGYDSSLDAKFGLSMLLEVGVGENTTQILYDVNQSATPIISNLRSLGISLDRLNSIFLSHCHFDHTGGLSGMLEEINRPIPVVAHPSLFRPCFEMTDRGLWPIGLIGCSQADLEARKAILTLTHDPLKLMAGVITTGEIPRINDFELPGEIYTIQDGHIVKDTLEDDAALVLNTAKGLVILAGCCHAGIVNTMARARALTNVQKIHAVIGGMHLWDAPEDRLDKTVEALEDVDHIFAGHCTGLRAMAKLIQTRGSSFSQISTGQIIRLPLSA